MSIWDDWWCIDSLLEVVVNNSIRSPWDNAVDGYISNPVLETSIALNNYTIFIKK